MNFKTKKEMIRYARNLTRLDNDLVWLSTLDKNTIGFEGTGLYEISKTGTELIYKPETDLSFEWDGVDYSCEQLCPECGALLQNHNDSVDGGCQKCIAFAEASPDAAMRSCWQCNPAHEHLKEVKGLFVCLECDRYYEEGVFI